jgi:hypothetical protein
MGPPVVEGRAADARTDADADAHWDQVGDALAAVQNGDPVDDKTDDRDGTPLGAVPDDTATRVPVRPTSRGRTTTAPETSVEEEDAADAYAQAVIDMYATSHTGHDPDDEADPC